MAGIKYMNNDEIELTCSQMLDRYHFSIGKGDMILPYVDIDNFVLNFLHCTIVYENIAEHSNCL